MREGLSLFSYLTLMTYKQMESVLVGATTGTGELQQSIRVEIVGKLVCVKAVDTKYNIKVARMMREGLGLFSYLTLMTNKQVESVLVGATTGTGEL